MAYTTQAYQTKSPVIAIVRDILAALNPVTLWEILQEADEGVCVMAPARVRQTPRRR